MSDYCDFTRNMIYNLDALTMLKTMPSESVNCIITSPPYYSLRDYGVEGQMGLEPTLREFIENMTALFHEARRVLRRDGTCWINMGDSYNSSPAGSPSKEYVLDETKGDGVYSRRYKNNHAGGIEKENDARVKTGWKVDGLKPKDLCGQPWRLAFALQDDGWYLRSDIIWHKPNPMPESVTDRPTKSHEYVFLLTKSERYWYDADAIREPAINGDPNQPRSSKGVIGQQNGGNRKQDELGKRTYTGFNERYQPLELRNKRTVWTIPTEPTPFAHFATFPQALIEPMILAGCPKEVCTVCGAPYVRVTEPTPEYAAIKESMLGQTHQVSPISYGKGQENGKEKARVTKSLQTLGFKPSCTCAASTRPGVVYDPFMGSGTTSLVAQRLGRDFCGSELNFEYLQIARGRLAHFDPKEFKREIKGLPTTQPMNFDVAS